MAGLRDTMLFRMLDHQEAKEAQAKADQMAAMQALTGQVARAGEQGVQQATRDQQLAQGLGQAAGIEGEPLPEMRDARLSEAARVGYAPGNLTREDKARAAAAQLLGQQRQASQDQRQAAMDQFQMDKTGADFALRQQEMAQREAHQRAQEAQSNRMAQIAMYNAESTRQRSDQAAINAGRDPKLDAATKKGLDGAMLTLAKIEDLERSFTPEQVAGWATIGGKIQHAAGSAASYIGAQGVAGTIEPDQAQRMLWQGKVNALVQPEIKELLGASRSASDIKIAMDTFAQTGSNPAAYPQALRAMKDAASLYLQVHSQAAKEGYSNLTPGEMDRRMDEIYATMNGPKAPTSAAGVPQSQPNSPENKAQKIKASYLKFQQAGYSAKDARTAALAENGEDPNE